LASSSADIASLLSELVPSFTCSVNSTVIISDDILDIAAHCFANYAMLELGESLTSQKLENKRKINNIGQTSELPIVRFQKCYSSLSGQERSLTSPLPRVNKAAGLIVPDELPIFKPTT